ncbi:defensin beta 118 [Erinaceus europaeus]|uniref:Beta-defensin n=1 Tax=Erinaceus europaeus TaxID=9365 RepID=A0A1S3WBW8_ERIEU|nr:defensin beta 118 [Erinaceus europaeus]
MAKENQGYHGETKCAHNSGSCRKSCKADEEIKTTCKNHRICCVPRIRKYGKIILKKKFSMATPTTLYKTQTRQYDEPLTIGQKAVSETDITIKYDDIFETETQTSPPEFFQYS